MIVGPWPDRRHGGMHRLRRGPAVRRARPGTDGRFHPRDGVVCHRRAGHRGQCGGRLYLAVHRRCRWTGLSPSSSSRFALGIDRWKNVYAVLASVAFAVFPTWAGADGNRRPTAARRGDDVPLNPATVTITLVGHLIFGLVLGLAFLKAPRGRGKKRLALGHRCRKSASAKRAIRFAKKVTHSPLAVRRPAGRRGFI